MTLCRSRDRKRSPGHWRVRGSRAAQAQGLKFIELEGSGIQHQPKVEGLGVHWRLTRYKSVLEAEDNPPWRRISKGNGSKSELALQNWIRPSFSFYFMQTGSLLAGSTHS